MAYENDEVLGHQAKMLLDDPAFRAAVSRLEADYVSAWRVASTTEARERCWQKLNVLEDLKHDLAAASASGAVAIHNVARLRRPTT